MKPAYTVIWKPSTMKSLADFVHEAMTDGTGGESVTIASAEIDRALKRMPTEAGESRDGDLRILFVSPLAITFEVREADRLVNVLRVSYRPARPQP